MADRITPPPSGDSGERRSTTSRPTSGYGEHPQTPRSTGGYSERPQQPTRSSSGYSSQPTRTSSAGGSYGARQQQPTRGYSDRPQAPRSSGSYGSQPTRSSSGSGAYGDRRSSTPRSGSSSPRSNSPRRVDLIRCENCGEDYSTSYKRCPFCDERPGRGGVSGKRVSNTRGGGYGRPVNPVQIAGLVISLVLIASALFIVFRFIGAPIFGNKNKPNGSNSSVSTSQSTPSGSTSQPGTTAPPVVQSIALNNSDVPLDNGATYQLTANLLPVGASGEVTWTSSDPTVATVDVNGLVTNLNNGSSDVRVTITAACNGVSAETAVTCKGKTAGGTGTATVGSRGRIVNAEKGLNIRSGPGTSYSVVASAQNGASITILGEENGFYKINYSGSNVGYVSKDYVSVG